MELIGHEMREAARMHWRNLVGLGSVAALLGACVALDPSNATADSWKAKISAQARAAVEAGAPSIQIAVGRDGKVLFEAGFGFADVENAVPATPESLYRTASISKWLTATAAMVLVEKGALDLDAPVQRYCPKFPENRWPITSRHLLTHTSGIHHYTDYADEMAAAQSDTARTEVELKRLRDKLAGYTRFTDVEAPLETFKNDPLRFKPGTAFGYSSLGYRVLACVLEGAGGRPYRTIMQDEVFAKAGALITNDDALAIIPGRAAGYSLSTSGGTTRAALRDVSENLPAGGHLATASDLVRFALALHAGDLISSQSISLMGSPFLKPDGQAAASTYGFGVNLMALDHGNYLGQSGGQPGTTTLLLLEREKGFAVAIMCNADAWAGLQGFAAAIMPIIAEELGGR